MTANDLAKLIIPDWYLIQQMAIMTIGRAPSAWRMPLPACHKIAVP